MYYNVVMMKAARISAFFALLFTICGISFAQPSMEPPAEIKKFAWMNGDWAGDVHWSMEGQEMDSKMTMKISFEGQFQKVSTVTDMQGMKMTEEAYMGWDAKSKKYKMWTFTNFSPEPRFETGTLEGDKMVTQCEPWNMGMGDPIVARATLTKKSDKVVDFTLEFKQGDKWAKVASGTFKKKG